MFQDYRLKELLRIHSNCLVKDSLNSEFIFVRKQHLKFGAIGRTVKYNVYFNGENNFFIFIPSAVCSKDTYVEFNFDDKLHKILDMKMVEHNPAKCFIMVMEIENEEDELLITAKNMWLNSIDKRELLLVERALAEKEKEDTDTKNYNEFLKIRDQAAKEISDVLKKYKIELGYSAGEYYVIHNGNHLYSTDFFNEMGM